VYANFGENRECLCFEHREIGGARLKGYHEIGSAVAYKLCVVLGASLRN